MYRVECSNKIKRIGFCGMPEVAQVADFKLNITQPGKLCLQPGIYQCLRGQVITHETGIRVTGSQVKQDPSFAAANVQNANTRFQLWNDMTDQRKYVFIKTGKHGLSAVLRHDLMKTRIMLVGNATTVAETLNDPVLDLPQNPDILCKDSNIVRCRTSRQQGGMASWQHILIGSGQVFDDAPGHHGSQPLLHIALIQTGMRCELLACRAG